MRRKPEKTTVSPPEESPMSSQDRQVLSEAYKTGVITGWKRAGDDGYRLTHGDRRDEFVATADLGRYLAKVRGRA